MKLRIRHIFLPFLIVFAYYIFFQAFYNMIAYHEIFPFQNIGELILSVLLNFPPILLTFILTILVVRYNRITGNLKIIFDFLFCLIGLVIINVLDLIIAHEFLSVSSGQIDWAATIFNLTITFLAVEVYYYNIRFRSQLKATEEQRRKIIQYRYEALKSQINPHFLFNSLNLLYSLIGDVDDEAKRFAVQLADVYRYILLHLNEEIIKLEEEMTFIQSYMKILRMRYDNEFQLIVKGEKIGAQMIVPFTLQLLVENVVKHNVISKDNPMTVILEISENHMVLTNPIHKRISDSSSSGIGLSYLMELYGFKNSDFRYDIEDGLFRVYVQFIGI